MFHSRGSRFHNNRLSLSFFFLFLFRLFSSFGFRFFFRFFPVYFNRGGGLGFILRDAFDSLIVGVNEKVPVLLVMVLCPLGWLSARRSVLIWVFSSSRAAIL